MKRLLLNFSLGITLLAASTLFADDAEQLAGKWSVKKLNDQGETFTQTIEVKKNKFVFEILGADGQPALHAEGDLKLEKMGPFNSARFTHIRAGLAGGDLQDVDEERTSVYMIDGDTWMVASNFDADRQQKPSV